MSGKVRGVLIDISPLRESAAFRRIFCARLISIIGIGPVSYTHLTLPTKA